MLHLGAVDLFGPIPVELIEGFDDGKTRLRDPASDRAVLASLALAFQKATKVLLVSPLLASGLVSQSLIIFLNEAQTKEGSVPQNRRFRQLGLGQGVKYALLRD